jgi:hypothetical protein
MAGMHWPGSASDEIDKIGSRIMSGEEVRILVKTTKSMTAHMIDRCLAAASHCIEHGNDGQAIDLMKAKFQEAAREVSLWELGGIKKAGLFLRPMEKALVKRHGPLVGREIYWDFVDSFWIQSWTDVPLEENRLKRPIAQTKEWHWRLMAHLSLMRLLSFEDHSSTLHRD